MKKLLFIFFFVLCLIVDISAQIVVIANKNVEPDTITSSTLLEYYSREKREWDNGQHIVVFDLKPKGKIKDQFYQYLGKSVNLMKSIWMVNLLSGEGDPPESLNSEDEMIEKVASTPGSVGFISQDKVTKAVKVLAVIKNKNL